MPATQRHTLNARTNVHRLHVPPRNVAADVQALTELVAEMKDHIAEQAEALAHTRQAVDLITLEYNRALDIGAQLTQRYLDTQQYCDTLREQLAHVTEQLYAPIAPDLDYLQKQAS